MLTHWLTASPFWNSPNTDLNFPPHTLGHSVKWFSGKKLPKLNKNSVALIGLDDGELDAVRPYLYPLTNLFNGLEIIDIGNIRKSTQEFIIPVIKELLVGGVFPVLIGKERNSLISLFQAYKGSGRSINVALIDEKLRFDTEGSSKYFPLNSLVGKKNHLFNLGLLAYQNLYTSPAYLQAFEQEDFDLLRLGRMRQNLQESEPYLRDADLLGFDLSAMKFNDAPGQVEKGPSGLTLEEACQLMRYGGWSDKLSSCGIWGFSASEDPVQTAQVVAQLLWYLIEGVSNRKKDFPHSNNGLVEYIVEHKDIGSSLVFWKSKKTGRWWMEVSEKTKKRHTRHKLIPCSYNDYVSASNGDIPNRLLKAMNRFA